MLKLKSQVKDIFKTSGLEDFTIGRDCNGYLAIVGPCGKDIVQVTNFSVGSKLTNEERTIAIEEYIEPTLTKHAHVIVDMIKFREAEVKAEDAVVAAVLDETKVHKTKAQASKSGYGFDNHDYTSSIALEEHDEDTNQTMFVKVARDSKGILDSNVKSIGTENLTRGAKVAAAMMKRLAKINILYDVYVNARKDFLKAESSMKAECSL